MSAAATALLICFLAFAIPVSRAQDFGDFIPPFLLDKLKACNTSCAAPPVETASLFRIEGFAGYLSPDLEKSCKGAIYDDEIRREPILGRRYTGRSSSGGCETTEDDTCPPGVRYLVGIQYGCEVRSDGKLYHMTVPMEKVGKAIELIKEL